MTVVETGNETSVPSWTYPGGWRWPSYQCPVCGEWFTESHACPGSSNKPSTTYVWDAQYWDPIEKDPKFKEFLRKLKELIEETLNES